MRVAFWSLILGCWSASLNAQSPASAPVPSTPSRATQISISGRSEQAGSVSATQSTVNSGGGNSVNLINSSISVQGQYAGSVAEKNAPCGVVQLSLEKALSMGLRNNLGAISQSQTVAQANGQRSVAKSALLPNLDSAVSEQVERLNLRTQGVESSAFPLTVQLNYFDARAVRLTQSVMDFVRSENLRGANKNVSAAIAGTRNVRDLVVLAVAGSYLRLTATAARIASATAEADTAKAVYQQALDRMGAGIAPRIDVTRSQVQFQTDQQRLRSLQGDLDTQKLELARLIGFPRGQQFVISGDYKFQAFTAMSVEATG